jgi:hypothetical protein
MYRNRNIIEYSFQRITAAIGDWALIRREMYFSFAARYSANQPVRTMSTLCPVEYIIIAVLHIPASISIWTYLRMLLVIYLQFDSRYNPQFLPNTAQICPFLLCQLWAPSIPPQLQICKLSIKYSIERISAATGGVTTIRCALYSTFAAKYSRPAPAYIMSTRV